MNTDSDTPVTAFPPELRKRLISLRRDLHRRPELSFEEHRTAERLEAELRDHGLEPRRVAGTGLVARIAGRSDGPVVVIRGDIDALPVTERTGLPFSSENEGVMHACGHDVHATWAVGAALLLRDSPAEGDVLLLLQPGEETGRGAARVLSEGVLDEADWIFGAHVDRRFPVGKVVAQEGPLAASADSFSLELSASGAHGARPHESADPIVAAAHTVVALQTIVSRRTNPADAAVVTVGRISGGSAPNVIPDSVRLEGTVRATATSVRETLRREIERVVTGTAQAFDVRADLDFRLGPPPVVNPGPATEISRRAVISVLGEQALVPLGFLNMAGEDFASYMERIPGCFLRIGAREATGEVIPAHSPRFYAAEEAIFVGSLVLAECAREASRSRPR